MLTVFSDIDGIYNYSKWYTDPRNPGNLYGQEGEIDPLCIERINKICAETDAKIVISSDWRVSWNGCLMRLQAAGMENIIDKTPMLEHIKGVTRGDEIASYLQWHPEVTNYVIIDDRTDFLDEQLPHFVHVDPMYGLTDEHVEKAINILNNEELQKV